MTFALIIIGIIIGGIFTILSLVFAIIGLANGNTRKALGWGAGFLVSLAIVVFSIIAMVRAVSEKVRSGVDWLEEHGNDYKTEANDYQKTERQYWLDTIQKYTNDMYAERVPADYYINKKAEKDSAGLIIIPFVYPYSIKYNSTTSTGDIISDISDSTFVKNISAMAMDQNFAIVKVDNSQSPEQLKANHPEIEYILYDLRTRNFETALNNEKLLDIARRIGYTGSTDMLYLSNSLSGYIEYPDYD